jgi:ABC-type lipopolysaccharide export system ATPase subunit
MEGVQHVYDALAEYDAINVKFGLPEFYEDPDKMDKLMQRQAELQDVIDATDAWNMDSKLDRAMAALNCPPGDWPVTNLSGGERRRTEIARCLAIEPRFVMLDEPFAGVDPIAVQEIQDVVWRLKDKNIGILITDHNVDETLQITDRAYLLFEGKILFHGTPEELASNPVVRKNYLGRDFVLKKKTKVSSEE